MQEDSAEAAEVGIRPVDSIVVEEQQMHSVSHDDQRVSKLVPP